MFVGSNRGSDHLCCCCPKVESIWLFIYPLQQLLCKHAVHSWREINQYLSAGKSEPTCASHPAKEASHCSGLRSLLSHGGSQPVLNTAQKTTFLCQMSSSLESRWETWTEAGEVINKEVSQFLADVDIKWKVWEIKQRKQYWSKIAIKRIQIPFSIDSTDFSK